MSNDIEEHFEKQLDRVNVWLSFAEAKNAALIAFNVTMITIFSDLYSDSKVIATFLIVLFIVSGAISLLSFIPKLFNRSRYMEYKNVIPDNLLFWADIAMIEDEKEYIELTRQRYYPKSSKEEAESNKNIDLASEIMINSKIANRKYNLFTQALKLDLLGLVIMIIFLVIA